MMIPASLLPRIKVMQIIAATLMMGVAGFIVFAGFAAQNNPPGPERTPVVTYLGLFMFASMIPASFLVPVLTTRRPLEAVLQRAAATSRGASPSNTVELYGALIGIRQTMVIMGLAPLEGAGLLNAIAYMAEREPLALGGAIGALLVMATRFPTVGSVAAWLEQQKQAARMRR